MTARQVFYEGRVQGVGFRYTAKRLATGFEVTGWVRNLPDGRVEMQVAGEEAEISDFLVEIRESVLGSHIRGEMVQEIPPPEGLRGFSIVH